MKTTVLTLLALLAFAGNSVLCRLALGGGMIDPVGFTTWRLVAGALTLGLLLAISNQTTTVKTINSPTPHLFLGPLMLFVYAACFSFAYVQLETGTGALVLFGVVQLTLVLIAVLTGHKPRITEWLGMLLAFAGLVYLLIPAWGSPSLLGFVLMAVAGVAWGLYTWFGKRSSTPLQSTAVYFIGTLPWVVLLFLLSYQASVWTAQGVLLAVASGAITSAIGYSIWYAVLPSLTAVQAGVIQLLVPVVAAFGGVLFAAEVIGLRLLFSSVLVLGGLLMVTRCKPKAKAMKFSIDRNDSN